VDISVLLNDTDPDSTEPLRVATFGQPGNGIVTILPGEILRYTPATTFFGQDSFVYFAIDGKGATDEGEVVVTVTRVNQPPTAVDDQATTEENRPVSIPVLANDSDPDGNPLAVIAMTHGLSGTVTLNQNGSLTYTPEEFFYGEDSFSYTIADGQGGTDTALVVVKVDPIFAPPESVSDAVILFRNPLIRSPQADSVLVSPLANDVERYGRTLRVLSVEAAGDGSVELLADNLVRYTPAAGFSGTDSFSYRFTGIATDTVGILGTIFVIVDPQTNRVVAEDDNAATQEDQQTTVDVLANDQKSNPSATLSILTASAQQGSVLIAPDKRLTYRPPANFHGPDVVTYIVGDGSLGADMATVTMTVNPVNDAPAAQPDTATTAEEQPLVLTPLQNDSDIDGDGLTITSVEQSKLGSAVIEEGKRIRYTPALNRTGADRLVYRISDSQGGTATSLIDIEISPVNDPPVAADDRALMDEDTTIVVPVLANDGDVDGDALTIASFGQAQHGFVSMGEGGLGYHPLPDYNGQDTFTYTISDGILTASASVTVQIRATAEIVYLPSIAR